MLNSIDIRDYIISRTKTDISSGRRHRNIVYTRFLYFKICRELTNESLVQIGEPVGRDHATVLHGLKMYDNGVLEHKYYVLGETLLRKLKNIKDVSESEALIMMPRQKIMDYYENKISDIHLEYLRKLEKLERINDKIVSNKPILMIANELSELSDADIHIFKETRLKPFISMRKNVSNLTLVDKD